MTYQDLLDLQSRRAFLRGMARLGGVALVAGCAGEGAEEGAAGAATDSVAAPTAGGWGERAGVQLYTVRDQLQNDFEGTLRRVAQIGYREVEFAGYYDRTPEQIGALLSELGLSAPSTHVGIEQFRGDLAALLEGAKTMGHQWVTVPALPELFSGAPPLTADQWRVYAEEFNRYGAAARAQGLRFAYHNHWQEFEPIAGSEQTGLDILLSETDPEAVAYELDLCWAVVGGRDPAQMFAQHPGRFPMWHVKDVRGLAEGRREAEGKQGPEKGAVFNARQVAVGEGEIDFAAIFAQASQSGLQHYFIELDEPQDSLAAIEASHRNLSRILA